MSIEFRHVESMAECEAAFLTMKELRPHLISADAFIKQFERQKLQGYRLLAAWHEDKVLGLSGYRLQENFIYGRFTYIDDLIVSERARSTGLGGQLLDFVRQEAVVLECSFLVLDTALDKSLAQQFYFRQGLLSKGLHFCQSLS